MTSSEAPLFPSIKETTNYARLCRLLVDVGCQVLRETFDAVHSPEGLHLVLGRHPEHAILQSLGRRRILRSAQWAKLYPTVPSSVSSANFDFFLLFVLLKNICGLTPPATGWNILPPATDVSVEANIVRLRYYRNVVYSHASQASVDDATFNSYWQDISDAIVGLGGASYGSAINRLKNECMDPLTEVKMKEKIQDIQDRVTDEIHQTRSQVEKLNYEFEIFLSQHEETRRRENIRSGFEQLRAEIGELSEYLASLKRQQDDDTKDEDVIPPYVLARGRLAVEPYQRVLQRLKTFWKRIEIHFIGDLTQEAETENKITVDLHQMRSQVQNLRDNLEPLVFQQGDRKSQENIRSMFKQLRANVRKLRDNLASLKTQQAGREDEDVIPPYVLARGPLAVEAYQRGLQSGRIFDKRTKILLIGQDRVGKTSLGKHLRGERFNPDEPSTDGVKMMPAIKNASLQAWKNPASLEFTSAFDHKCAEVVTKELQHVNSSPEKSDPAPQFTEESVTGNKDGRRKQKQEQVLREVTSSGNSRRTAPIQIAEGDTEQIPGNVASLVESSLERNGPNKHDSIWPVIWDFAGQAVYRAIHPIFLSQEAIYVLAFDLTRELAAPAQCRVRPFDHAEVEVTSPDTEDTNLDHILKWLDLVHSLLTAKKLGQTTEGAFPPVILVGTHADSVRNSGRDPTKVMEAVLDKIFDVAPREVVDHIHDSFVIDNTKAGNPYQQEDSEIVSLRQKILELAEKMPHTKKEVPLQWLRVEEKVFEMVKKEEYYLPKKRFQEDVAEAICHFDVKDDIKELLHFLHSRGTIVHHDLPQNPDGIVVLDPQWLISVLIKMITVNPTWKAAPYIKRHYRILENEGFLSNDLLNHAFENLKLERARENLLEVMEKFNLICNSRGCKGRDFPYFVPCMLTLPMKNTRSKDIDNGPLPVFLTFNTNYVPSGIFCRLVALFWRWASELCGSYIEPTLYAKSARFNVSKLYHITLEAHKTLISVKLWTNGDSNQEEEKRLCRELLSYLGLCWTTLHSTCQWLKSVSWNVSVQCTLCKPCPDKCLKKTDICIWHKQQGCRHPDCGHHISLRDFAASCKYFVYDAPSFCQGKLDPWTQAFSEVEKGNGISAQSGHRSTCKRPIEESLSHSPNKPPTKRKRPFEDNSAQKEHRSTCKRPIEESLSCSPDKPPRKRKRPLEAIYVVKDGKPSDYELEELSQELGEKWEELGGRLGFNQAAITNFYEDNRRSSRRAFCMLLAWKQKEGSEATYTVLYNALCDKLVKCKQLAEQFCCDKIVQDSDELIAQLQHMQLDASKVNDKTDLDIKLKKIATNKGFRIVDNEGSGNCLFYALSDQLEIAVGIKIKHDKLRQILVQYLRKNPRLPDGTDLFHFVHGHQSWADYLRHIEQDGAWGDHVILCAAANYYRTSIRVVSSLPRIHDAIIKPHCPVDQSKTLVLGHIHELHYVSLRPIQGSKAQRKFFPPI